MIDTWTTIASSTSPAEGVRAQLAARFADSGDGDVIDRLMSHFASIDVDEHGARVAFKYPRFDHLFVVRFSLPGEMSEPIASLQSLVAGYGPMSGSCLGGGDIAFPGGNDISDFLQNEDEFPSTPMMAFDVGQNIMIAHPEDTNSRGEPTLYFIDHDDGEAKKLGGADELTAAQVYLRLLAQHLDGEEYFENVGA